MHCFSYERETSGDKERNYSRSENPFVRSSVCSFIFRVLCSACSFVSLFVVLNGSDGCFDILLLSNNGIWAVGSFQTSIKHDQGLCDLVISFYACVAFVP